MIPFMTDYVSVFIYSYCNSIDVDDIWIDIWIYIYIYMDYMDIYIYICISNYLCNVM